MDEGKEREGGGDGRKEGREGEGERRKKITMYLNSGNTLER